jgi:hypothetical protein
MAMLRHRSRRTFDNACNNACRHTIAFSADGFLVLPLLIVRPQPHPYAGCGRVFSKAQ